MELVTLDSAFQPNELVENYQSLIWSERYSTNGDFELKSTNIADTVKALPLESYVSLRESNVPMVVEIYNIEKKPNESPSLVVTGRSFETVLERRASVRDSFPLGTVNPTRTAWMMAAAKESDVAYRTMRNVLGDYPQYQSGQMVLPLRDAPTPADIIPEISLTMPADYQTTAWGSAVPYSPGDLVGLGTTIYQATTKTSPPNVNMSPDTNPTYWTVFASGLPNSWGFSGNYEIKPQDLYTTVMEFVTANHHGLKSVRPVPGGSQVGIEVYNGAIRDDLVFDVRFDQFDDAKYLLSAQGSANVAYVYGSNGSQEVLKNTPAPPEHPEPFGLNRRVVVVDNSTDATVNTNDIRNTRGLIELYNLNATALFDGQISTQIASLYNQPDGYFLGDIVSLVGEYNLPPETVRIAEFIRSVDSSGEKAYPTFEIVV